MADERRSVDESTPDADLMRRVAGGETEALGVLFRRHYAAVVALCARLTGRSDVAHDVAQDAFLRVLRHARSYDGFGPVRAWLFRVAYNAAMDHLRQHRRRERDERAWVQESSRMDEPEVAAKVALEQALTQLPAAQREIVVLTRLHDLKLKDAAAVVGCTPEAARVRLHRALKQLRRLWREIEGHQ